MTRHRLVDLGEVPEVGQVHGQSHDVLEAAFGRNRHGREVLEHALDLCVNARRELARFRVEPNLPGQVDGIAGTNGLRIGADGSRRVRSADLGLGHRQHAQRTIDVKSYRK